MSIEENFTCKLQMQQIVLEIDNIFRSTVVVDDDCSRVSCRSAATSQECLFTFFAFTCISIREVATIILNTFLCHPFVQ